MRSLLRWGVLALFVVPHSTMVRAEDEKTPKVIQGGWRLVSIEVEAADEKPAEPAPVLVIEKDRLLYGGEDVGAVSAGAEGELKSFDLSLKKPERSFEGVYVLEKDTLTVCLNGQTDGIKERPTSLKLEGHPAWRLYKFERLKPGEPVTNNGFVGMILRSDKERNVVVLEGTVDESPAREAGLLKGDELVRVNGAAATSLQESVAAARKAKAGDEIVVVIKRDGKEQEIKVKVKAFPLHFLLHLV